MSVSDNLTGQYLDSLLANRLLFETRHEFEEYADYDLSNNNQLSGMAQRSARDLLARLAEDFLSPTGRYSDFDLFFSTYERASAFFGNNMEGKAMLKDPDCAFKMGRSLFYTHEPTGEKKLDAVLNLLYDFEIEDFRTPYVDPVMIIAMSLGVLPRKRQRAATADPDYINEGKVVLEFVSRIISLNNHYEENPVLVETERELNDESLHKTRILFLEWLSRSLFHVDEVTRPEGLDEAMQLLPLDGYWQNWNDKGRTDKNVFYHIEWKCMAYNFTELVVNATQITRTTYHAELFREGEDLIFYLIHPKGAYEQLMGQPVSRNLHVWLICKTDGHEKNIRELSFTYKRGAKNFEVRLDKLRKVEGDDVKILEEKLCTAKIKDKYEQYSCIYQGCVYAVTKTDIYLGDPDEEGWFYKVPRDIDDRLYDISVDSVAGMLKVGLEEKYWIGFEPCAMTIPPDRFEELGIEHVGRIV